MCTKFVKDAVFPGCFGPIFPLLIGTLNTRYARALLASDNPIGNLNSIDGYCGQYEVETLDGYQCNAVGFIRGQNLMYVLFPKILAATQIGYAESPYDLDRSISFYTSGFTTNPPLEHLCTEIENGLVLRP